MFEVECLMKSLSRAALAAFLASTAVPALSADIPARAKAPAPVFTEPSPWMIRVRALGVVPRDNASVSVNGAAGIPNLDITNSVVPELDITYFFTKNIAAELVLGVTPHDVKPSGQVLGVTSKTIGSTWLLPPTLTLQYHFTEMGAFKPYVGAGVNYTFTFNNEAKGDFTQFKLKSAPGFALQAGIDFMLDKNWGINFDVKKLWLRLDATGYAGAPVTAKVKLDPWLIGVGVTYRL
jgi:outer membrane protein